MQRLQIILISIVLAACSVAEAGDTWFVDTRTASELTVKKLGEDNRHRKQWVPARMEDFLATHEPNKPLVIIIHGNWMTSGEAKSHGMTFDRLTENLGDFRLLVWTWPSDRINCGIRKDALLKARRADLQARHLVNFLRNLKPNSKISLIGFSFGAKLVCETLQLLATSEDKENVDTLQIRSVLLAGALDCGSLKPGRQYGQALSVTKEMLVHVNPDDETLCYYPLLIGIGGPQAVGKEGIVLSGISKEDRQKIKSVNVNRILDTEHAFMASFHGFIAAKKDFCHYALFE